MHGYVEYEVTLDTIGELDGSRHPIGDTIRGRVSTGDSPSIEDAIEYIGRLAETAFSFESHSEGSLGMSIGYSDPEVSLRFHIGYDHPPETPVEDQPEPVVPLTDGEPDA